VTRLTIDRRAFLGGLAASTVALRPRFGPLQVATGSAPIMDAMGELRPDYPAEVVRDMLATGLRSITVTLCDPKPEGNEALALAIDGLVEYDRYLARHPEWFLKATSIKDFDLARRSGRMAVFYLYQNSVQFGADLDRVDLFYRMGLRSCQLTYNDRNRAGAGCRAEGRLTEFGRGLIDRMNRLGMLIDLSHANMETMAEAIAASTRPVVVSHTGCAAVHPHVRNTTDANLRALADRGGVVGICQIRPFLTDRKRDNLDAYLDHIDHAVIVAGNEQVAIGSDRDYRVIEMTPEYLEQLRREEGAQIVDQELPLFLEALNGPRRMETISNALTRRGYRAGQVEKILGGNLHRLYRAVIG
jgi:membrane dipeptidase